MAEISLSSRFSWRAGVLFANVGDDVVLLDTRCGQYFSLNQTGSVLWRGMGDGKTFREILTDLGNRFDVEPDRLLPDASKLVRDLLERDLANSVDDGAIDG